MPLPPLYKPNLASYNYTRALFSAHQRYPYIYDSADFASIEDNEAWEKIRRDALLAAAIENRRRSVASIDWQLNPASDDPGDKLVAELMTDLLHEIRHFWRARYNLSEAIFRGSAFAMLCGQRRSTRLTSDGDVREWWVPDRLPHIDRWRFRIARTQDRDPNGPKVPTTWEMFSVARDQWEIVRHPHWFLRHYYERQESDLGYGRGLLQSIYFYFRAKEIVLSQGLAGVERWCQGLVTAKVDTFRAGSTDTDNTTIRDEWIDELKKTMSEHVLVYGGDDQIEVHWPSGTGHQMVLDFVRYLDQQMLRLIQASDLTTGQGHTGKGGSSSGSYAQSKTQADEKDDYFEADRIMLAEDLEHGLVRTLYKLNARPLAFACMEQGVPLGKCPTFSLSSVDREDPSKAIEVVSQMLQAGMPLVKHEVYERLGWKVPGEDDEVIEPPEQQPASPFGGGMGGMFGGQAVQGVLPFMGSSCGPGQTAKQTDCEPVEPAGGGHDMPGAEGGGFSEKARQAAQAALTLYDVTDPAAMAARKLAISLGMSEAEAVGVTRAAILVDWITPGAPVGTVLFLGYTLARRPRGTMEAAAQKIRKVKKKAGRAMKQRKGGESAA